jgi:hypothetical protein
MCLQPQQEQQQQQQQEQLKQCVHDLSVTKMRVAY